MFAIVFPGVFAPVYGDGSCFAGFEVDCEAMCGERGVNYFNVMVDAV